MRKIKELLYLHFEKHLSARDIAKSLGIGRATIGNYLVRVEEAGLSWPLPPELDEATLEDRLFPPIASRPIASRSESKRQMPSMAYLHQELRKKKHVTLQLLWHEYKQNHPDGYQYSQFCCLYRHWAAKLDPSLHQEYRAGEKLFVDYAGQSMEFTVTGDIGSKTTW